MKLREVKEERTSWLLYYEENVKRETQLNTGRAEKIYR